MERREAAQPQARVDSRSLMLDGQKVPCPFGLDGRLRRGHRIAVFFEVPGARLRRRCHCKTEETSDPRECWWQRRLGCIAATSVQYSSAFESREDSLMRSRLFIWFSACNSSI